MSKIKNVYLFVIEEMGKEDILCYPGNQGSMIPMIAVDKERLKQYKEVADEMMTHMKRTYVIKKFHFSKQLKMGE
jgi:hypothetical protein